MDTRRMLAPARGLAQAGRDRLAHRRTQDAHGVGLGAHGARLAEILDHPRPWLPLPAVLLQPREDLTTGQALFGIPNVIVGSPP
jgi:hypothetical protein